MPRSFAHILIAAVALVAAGCGANAVPDDDVAAAAEATKAEDSARVETVTRMSFGSEQSVFRTTGVVEYANDRRDEETQYPAAGDSVPQTIRAITIGSVTWSEVPNSDAFPPGSKRWLRSDAAEAEKMVEEQSSTETSEDGSVTSVRMVSSSPETSPDAFLDYLDGVAPDPERLGEERVRGVQTTRYRTQLDLERATRRDLEREGWAEPNIQHALEGMEGGPAEIEIWIGADGLIRRVVLRTESARRPNWSIETTTEFFDFGVDTKIEPPPEDEVMEQAEWLRVAEEEQKQSLGENQVVGERP